MPTRPNLTVIRCVDIDASALFYRLIGLEFEKHRHGIGRGSAAFRPGRWERGGGDRHAGVGSGRLGTGPGAGHALVEEAGRVGRVEAEAF